MKRFLSIFFILIFILAVFNLNSKKKVKFQEPIFIGHVYGDHDYSDIPYKPLKKVISKNNLDFIIFGGDITKDHKDFYTFNSHFSHINKLYIKGNHDSNIYDKTEFWKKKTFKNLNLINLSNKKFQKYIILILIIIIIPFLFLITIGSKKFFIHLNLQINF